MEMFKTLTFVFIFCFKIHKSMAANENSSFSFNGFVKSPSFYKNLGLFGDSKLVNESSSIQLTDSVSQSKGRVIYMKPIKLFQGKDKNKKTSFSTYFSFSMSNEINGGLAFVMVPSNLDLTKQEDDATSSGLGFLLQSAKNSTVFAVEFSVSKRGNFARILISKPGSAPKIKNLPFNGDLMMNSKDKLTCWIDYEANSKKLNVRMRRFGTVKLLDPYVFYSVDLGKLFESGEVMVGLSSANGNSLKPHFLHSWSFEVRHPPLVKLHSEPLVPYEVMKSEEDVDKPVVRSECRWRMVGALVLGVVCGVLGTMLGFYFWRICSCRSSMAVVPEECVVKTVNFKVVDKVAATGDEEGKK